MNDVVLLLMWGLISPFVVIYLLAKQDLQKKHLRKLERDVNRLKFRPKKQKQAHQG